jgi:hypothetical protein
LPEETGLDMLAELVFGSSGVGRLEGLVILLRLSFCGVDEVSRIDSSTVYTGHARNDELHLVRS